jgi:hypothetical protein
LVLFRPATWLAFLLLFAVFKAHYVRLRLDGYSREEARCELALMLDGMTRWPLEELRRHGEG